MHLKKQWVADLPNLTLLINKINEFCDEFDPTQFVDSNLNIEKLMKMSKEFKKKNNKLTENTQKFFWNSVTIMLVNFFFFACNFLFDLLNWVDQSLYILIKNFVLCILCGFFCGLFSVKTKYGK